MSLGSALLISLAISVLKLSSFVISGIFIPLLTGVVTGLFIGEPVIGLQIGATCSLMALGFYTYGGSVTPSYEIGAVFGVIIAAQSGDYNQGILVGSVVALIVSWFVILKAMMNTVFMHQAEKELQKNNSKGLEFWHYMGMVAVFVTTFVPVFIGLMFIDKYQIILTFVEEYTWLKNGLSVVGALLPAVGFALLLSYMDIKNYWPFMFAGYSLFAYLGMPTLGLAIIGCAVAYLYAFKLKKIEEA